MSYLSKSCLKSGGASMSETPFYKTRMGHQFYESTMPRLVEQLERLNDLLEKMLDRKGTDRTHKDR